MMALLAQNEAGRDLQSRPGLFVQGSSFLPGTKRCGRDGMSRPAKHLHNRLVTVHGLDFGIPAEMTSFQYF